MNKKVREVIAKELVKIAKDLVGGDKIAKFPPKAVDLNKLPNTDEFWKWSLKDAKLYSGSSFERGKEIGDLIMFMNMAASSWEKIQRKASSPKIAKDLVGGSERDYLFLGRMQKDFDYALNERSSAYGQERHLMMLNFEDQLKEMKKLWNRVDEKPEWLTKRDIANYENKIKKLRRSKVSKDLVSAQPIVGDVDDAVARIKRYAANNNHTWAVYHLVTYLLDNEALRRNVKSIQRESIREGYMTEELLAKRKKVLDVAFKIVKRDFGNDVYRKIYGAF